MTALRHERGAVAAPSALPDKYKSLASLAVASQIPCRYCVIADTEFAKLGGATDAEIAEAVAIGDMTRHWATLMTGLGVDEAQHRKDMDRVAKMVAVEAAKAAGGAKATAMTATK